MTKIDDSLLLKASPKTTCLFIPFILSLLIAFLAIGCGGEGEKKKNELDKDVNFRPYYFPVEELKSPKIYRYRSQTKERTDTIFWKIHALERDDTTLLEVELFEIFDNALIKSEVTRERITDRGSFAQSFKTFEFGSKGTIHTCIGDIYEDELIKWNPYQDPKMIWTTLYDSKTQKNTQIRFERRRKYKGATDTVFFNGKEHDCIIFKDQFDFKYLNKESGGATQDAYTQETYYAKGIGMIKNIRTFQDSTKSITRLSGILSQEEWEMKTDGLEAVVGEGE